MMIITSKIGKSKEITPNIDYYMAITSKNINIFTCIYDLVIILVLILLTYR